MKTSSGRNAAGSTAMRPLTQPEMVALLEAIRKHSTQPWADVLLVCLVFVTGAPPSMLLGLRLRDLDLGRLTLTLRTEQGQVCEVAPVPEVIAQELSQFAAAHGVTEPGAVMFVALGPGGTLEPMTSRSLTSTLRALEDLVALPGVNTSIVGLWALASFTRDRDIRMLRVFLQDWDTAKAAAVVGRWGGWHPLLGSKDQ